MITGLNSEFAGVKIFSRKAKLEDGTIVDYDRASETSPVYNNHTYLGKGTIHSINDIPQKGDELLHFFKENC